MVPSVASLGECGVTAGTGYARGSHWGHCKVSSTLHSWTTDEGSEGREAWCMFSRWASWVLPVGSSTWCFAVLLPPRLLRFPFSPATRPWSIYLSICVCLCVYQNSMLCIAWEAIFFFVLFCFCVRSLCVNLMKRENRLYAETWSQRPHSTPHSQSTLNKINFALCFFLVGFLLSSLPYCQTQMHLVSLFSVNVQCFLWHILHILEKKRLSWHIITTNITCSDQY